MRGGADGTAVTDRVVTIPNAISSVRLLLVPVFAWCIFNAYDAWAIGVLAVSGLTDYLDGFLARRLRQASVFGAGLDPAADRLFILSTLLGLAYRDLVPWWLVVLIVARDVALVIVTAPTLRRLGLRHLPVHFLGKAATFNLLYAFPLILLGEGDSGPALLARITGWAFAWWGTGLYWWAGYLYLKQIRSFSSVDAGAPGPRPPG